MLASRADGAPFGDVMRQRVLAPLGMRDTAFHAGDAARLATAYEVHGGELVLSDPPDGQWSSPPAFHDGGAGLVSTVDDVVAFGRMLATGGGPVLARATAAEMTRDQLTPAQREFWPGFSFLDERSWGYGVAVAGDGRYGWEGGSGTMWANVPSQDLTVVVLTQRSFDEHGPPAICGDVLDAARAGVATTDSG